MANLKETMTIKSACVHHVFNTLHAAPGVSSTLKLYAEGDAACLELEETYRLFRSNSVVITITYIM